MKGLIKSIAAASNALSFICGVFTALMLILKRSYTPVFSVAGFSQNENLIFNLLAIEIPLLLLCIIASQFAAEGKSGRLTVEYPTVYALVPLAIAVINTVMALRVESQREKMFVIIGSVIYFIAAAIMLFFGSKVFQVYGLDKEKEDD